jgi:predicted permease
MRTVRLAVRRLAGHSLFAASAIASLSLGLGAICAIFTLTDALLLRPLAVEDPASLVHISIAQPDGRPGRLPVAAAELLGQQKDLFASSCGLLMAGATVKIGDRVAPVSTHVVSGDCFAVFGVRPALGRLLSPSDDQASMPPVAMLSYDEWMHSFQGSPDVLGQRIEIEGTPFSIVGVTERGFRGVQFGFPTSIFYAFGDPVVFGGFGPAHARAQQEVDVIARLQPGVTPAVAQERLGARWREVVESTMPQAFRGARADGYRRSRPMVETAARGVDSFFRPRFRLPLLALFGICGVLLIVIGVNLANLLLIWAAERRGETLIRAALGAPRRTLLIDCLAEGAIVMLVSTMVGVFLSRVISAVLVATFGATIRDFSLDLTPDARIVGFTVAMMTTVFVACTVVPAWAASRVDVTALNAASSRIVAGSPWFRRIAVVAEVTFAVVLLSAGALFVLALVELKTVNLGMNIDRVEGAQLVPLPGGYGAGFAPDAYYRALLADLNAMPGVTSAALTRPMMLSGFMPFNVQLVVADKTTQAGAQLTIVSDEFFSTLQIPLVAGTAFSRTRASSQGPGPDVILSESAAQSLFGSRSAVGQMIRIGTDGREPLRQVVGVARDAVLVRPQQPIPRTVYVNFWQVDSSSQSFPSLLVRLEEPGTAGNIEPEIARLVRARGHEYALAVQSLNTIRDSALMQERLLAFLATSFGALGLSIVGVGLYSLLRFAVAQRAQEMGLRIALGATRSHIAWLVCKDAAMPVLTGLLVGAPAAFLIMRVAASLLYGQSGSPGRPIATAVAFIVAVTIVAILAPARRAATTEPMQALRHE